MTSRNEAKAREMTKAILGDILGYAAADHDVIDRCVAILVAALNEAERRGQTKCNMGGVWYSEADHEAAVAAARREGADEVRKALGVDRPDGADWAWVRGCWNAFDDSTIIHKDHSKPEAWRALTGEDS